MPSSAPPKCWFCGSLNIRDNGAWHLCADCHASTVEIPSPGALAMVTERTPVAERESLGMDKTHGLPPRPRGRPLTPKPR